PGKLGDWTADSVAATKAATPGNETLINEAGLLSATTKTYHAGGNRTIPVTLYTFKDSSGAYEAYAFLNGLLAKADSNHTLLVNGNLVLQIPFMAQSSTEIPPVEKWLASASDHVASPPIATYLPETNKDALSQRYALGKIGFQTAAKETGSEEIGKLA